MAKRKDGVSEVQLSAALQKKRRLHQDDPASKMPDNSSSIPIAANRQNDKMDELFGSLKTHNVPSLAADDSASDAADAHGFNEPDKRPEPAKRHSDDMDKLFDSFKGHEATHSAAEETVHDEVGNLSDKPSQQRKGKREGEFEDLFATLKKQRAAKADKQALRKQMLGKRKPAGSKDDIFGRGITKARRRDADGFAIYSEEELSINKGGNTPQCPFDCECCL